MSWTDEQREEAVARYLTAVEGLEGTEAYDAGRAVITEMADEFERSAVSVQTIISRSGNYIAKPAGATASSSGEKKATRVSKADAIADLRSRIEAIDPDLVDDAILDKLTGKAAVYIASVLNSATS